MCKLTNPEVKKSGQVVQINQIQIQGTGWSDSELKFVTNSATLRIKRGKSKIIK